jgi:hypothetical protein
VTFEGPLARLTTLAGTVRGSRWTLWVVVTAAAGLSLLMRALVPIYVVGSGGDDLLFERSAAALITGHWLGTFNYLTLSKGPSYSTFIAAMHTLHIPLKVGEQLTTLFAAGLLACCISVVLRRVVFGVAAFLIFAFLPDNFATLNATVVRDGWYASLSLVLVAAFFLTVYGTLAAGHARWPVLLAGLTGLTGAAFWLCREEGIWILPPLAVLTVWFVLRLVRADDSRPFVRRIRRPVAVLAVLILTAAAPIVYVRVENSRVYGAGLTNDMASGQIPRAYAEWLRVRGGPYDQRVPINKEQRQAVYAVSPAAHELKKWLDDLPNGWRNRPSGCMRRPDGYCDYIGDFEIWAIRAAAQSAGHFGSEKEVQRFFGEIADQIAAACSSGRLDCAPDLPTVLQPLQRVRIGALAAAFGRAVPAVVWSPDFTQTGAEPLFAPKKPAFDRTWRVVYSAPVSYQQTLSDVQAFQRHDLPYRVLEQVYRFGFPIFLLAGLVGLVLATVRRRGSPLVVLGGALLAGVFSRLVLLAVTATTEVTSGSRYQMPTRTLLFAMAAVGTALLIDVWKPLKPDASQEDHPSHEDALAPGAGG